jgi:DNA ligase-1
MFEKLNKAVEELQADSSSTNKVELLKKHLKDDFVKRCFFYTYNPLYQFHVTSSLCKKKDGIVSEQAHKDIFSLLDDLRTRAITGHDAVGCVNAFVAKNKGYEDLIYSMIDKDLKTRTAEKVINKAIPGLIPEFEVALSEKFEEKIVDFSRDDWYASRKLDGVRCLIVADEAGKVTCFSRQGKIFETLGLVEDEVKKIGLKNVVLDCEVCLLNNDSDDFQGIMKLIRKKDFTIPNPTCKLFDFLTMDEFTSKKSKRILSERVAELKNVIPSGHAVLQVLPQTHVENKKQYDDLMIEAAEKGWEGLILRKDSPYQGKRSKDLLKCKNFHDAEYVVKGVEMGPFRYVCEGQEKEEEMLSCVTIEHKGHEVRVGSGWGIDQRKAFHKKPQDIIGKTITVQYFEETRNQEGGISLRFPTVKVVHGEERET